MKRLCGNTLLYVLAVIMIMPVLAGCDTNGTATTDAVYKLVIQLPSDENIPMPRVDAIVHTYRIKNNWLIRSILLPL